MERSLAAYVGIDWASEEHEICALDPAGGVLGRKSVAHSGEGLDELCSWLLTLGEATTPAAVHVAIEVPHGPIVETLLERGFAVYAINPKQLDRFRDRFSPAGAKDDRLDALVLASSLRTDRERFRRLEIEEPTVIELRGWSRMLGELKTERGALSNRIRHELWRYYPQMLAVSSEVHTAWFLALWALAPTPAKAKRVRVATVARTLKDHRIRRIDADTVLKRLREPALTVAPGTTKAAVHHIQFLSERIKVLNRQIKACEGHVDTLVASLIPKREDTDDSGLEESTGKPCDVEILNSLPGVGRIVLATLLAEAWRPLRNRDYQTLRAQSGVAPVTRRSGKKLSVIMRHACNDRLREALYHWSRVAAQKDPRAHQRYAALRKRGHRHGRALRGVGDRLLAVACAMLRNRTLYDPDKAAVHTTKAAA